MEAMMKKCRKCGEEKALSEYYRNKKTRDGLKNKCKDCCRAYQAGHKARPEVKERAKAYMREWIERPGNREKTRARKQTPEYKARQKAYMKEYRNEYQNRRRREDPIYRMRQNVSSAVRKALFRNNGGKDGQATFTHLPYTVAELKEHLEKQFDDTMTWENYGSYWEIDHIYPQSLLPYESLECENFQKAWALSNLQPLESRENKVKGNRT